MTPHRAPSIAVLVIGAAACAMTQVLGPISLVTLALALAVAVGRARGSVVAEAIARRAPVTLAALIYLPLFGLDLARGVTSDPVVPLARLVAFLAAIELATGGSARPHRPLLLALLFMVVTAAETTDAWYFPFLVLFAVSAVAALSSISLRSALPRSAELAATGAGVGMPRRAVAALSAAALVAGAALFLVIPHEGTGWGTVRLSRAADLPRATGLSGEVELGSIGRVKKLQTVALRARQEKGAGSVDLASIYWRAHALGEWTGKGWRRMPSDEEPEAIRLWRGRRWNSGDATPAEGGTPRIFEVRLERPGLTDLLFPGRPAWLASDERSTVTLDGDGLPQPYRGAGPRRYRVATSERPIALRGDADPFRAAPALDPAVAAWADTIGPEEPADAARLARAFESDLRARPYSLDTTSVDPERPIASFLEGAPAHCEYFATAMTLGLRHRGVPARVVGGYLGADRLPLLGDLIVREDRAHLWVEVAVDGEGWVRFDPTPADGREPVATLASGLAALYDWSVVFWDSWVIGIDLDDQQNLWLELVDRVSALAAWIARQALPLGGTALVLVAGLLGWRTLRRRRADGRGARVPRYARLLMKEAKRQGIVWSSGATASELAELVGARSGCSDEARFVLSLYERERFGGVPADPGERRAAERAVAAIAAVRRTRKVA